MLVHGNAKNLSKKIRFAYNIGVIGSKKKFPLEIEKSIVKIIGIFLLINKLI